MFDTTSYPFCLRIAAFLSYGSTLYRLGNFTLQMVLPRKKAATPRRRRWSPLADVEVRARDSCSDDPSLIRLNLIRYLISRPRDLFWLSPCFQPSYYTPAIGPIEACEAYHFDGWRRLSTRGHLAFRLRYVLIEHFPCRVDQSG